MHDLAVTSADTPGQLAQLGALIGDPALTHHLAQPRYQHAFTQLAWHADTLVGYALLAHQRRQLGSATIEAGVLQVLHAPTSETFAALLGACLATLAYQGLPLFVLSGSPGQFGALGFAPYQFAYHTSLATNLPVAPTIEQFQLKPLTTGHLDDLAALYSTSYQALPLADVRAAPDWRAWLATSISANLQSALGLEDRQGRLLGYASGTAASGVLHVHEAAIADAGLAHSLLSALAAVAQRAGCTSLGFALPLAHPLIRAALFAGGTLQMTSPANSTEQHLPLAGIVDLAEMLRQITPELERRLSASSYADWQGTLHLESTAERTALRLANRRISVQDAIPPPDVVVRRMRLPALAQLLLGYRAAADLRATGDLACADSALGLVDSLFPVI